MVGVKLWLEIFKEIFPYIKLYFDLIVAGLLAFYRLSFEGAGLNFLSLSG